MSVCLSSVIVSAWSEGDVVGVSVCCVVKRMLVSPNPVSVCFDVFLGLRESNQVSLQTDVG